MSETFWMLASFALGFMTASVPGMVKQYFYRRQLEALSEGELLGVVDDEEDVAERERKEEETIGFFA